MLDHQKKARKPRNIYKEGIEQKSLLDGIPRYIYSCIYMYILYRIFKIHCCCPSQFGFLHHDIPRMKAIASFIFLHHRYPLAIAETVKRNPGDICVGFSHELDPKHCIGCVEYST